MGLLQLIKSYGQDLYVVPITAMPEVVERYREFGRALMALPKFVYTAEGMCSAMARAAGMGHNDVSCILIAEYAVRRAALQPVGNSSRRAGLWEIMELEKAKTGMSKGKL